MKTNIKVSSSDGRLKNANFKQTFIGTLDKQTENDPTVNSIGLLPCVVLTKDNGDLVIYHKDAYDYLVSKNILIEEKCD